MYPDVSRAYWEAVHAVLTRKTSATQAAQELQDKLEEMLKTPAVRTNTELDKVPCERKVNGRHGSSAHDTANMEAPRRIRLRILPLIAWTTSQLPPS
jgi:hypothetical protein